MNTPLFRVTSVDDRGYFHVNGIVGTIMKTFFVTSLIIVIMTLAGCTVLTRRYENSWLALRFDYPASYSLDEVREEESTVSLFFSTEPLKGRYVTVVLRDLTHDDDLSANAEVMLAESIRKNTELVVAKGGSVLFSEASPVACKEGCCTAKGWMNTIMPSAPGYPEPMFHLTSYHVVMSCDQRTTEIVAFIDGAGPDIRSDRFVLTLMKTLRQVE